MDEQSPVAWAGLGGSVQSQESKQGREGGSIRTRKGPACQVEESEFYPVGYWEIAEVLE